MLKNAPTLAIVAVHTEENEPPRILIWNTTNIYIHYFIPRSFEVFEGRPDVGQLCDHGLHVPFRNGDQFDAG